MIKGRVKSLQEQHYIQFAKVQLIAPILLMRKNSPPKALPTKHIYLSNLFR